MGLLLEKRANINHVNSNGEVGVESLFNVLLYFSEPPSFDSQNAKS